jgi:hypothetical protein
MFPILTDFVEIYVPFVRRTAARKGRPPGRVDRVAIEGGFLPWLHASSRRNRGGGVAY